MDTITWCSQFSAQFYLLSMFALEKTSKISNPVRIYMFKVNNRNTRTRCEIYSKLTIKTPEQRLASFWYLCYLWTYFTPCSSVSFVNVEHVIADWEYACPKKLQTFTLLISNFHGWQKEGPEPSGTDGHNPWRTQPLTADWITQSCWGLWVSYKYKMIKIYQYLRLHMKIIRWKFHIKTFYFLRYAHVR